MENTITMDDVRLLTGKFIQNKVLDSNGRLLPQYCNVRYTRNGVVTYDLEVSFADVVDTGVHANQGVLGLSKVEWRGEHIGEEWRDVTDRYKALYHAATHASK